MVSEEAGAWQRASSLFLALNSSIRMKDQLCICRRCYSDDVCCVELSERTQNYMVRGALKVRSSQRGKLCCFIWEFTRMMLEQVCWPMRHPLSLVIWRQRLGRFNYMLSDNEQCTHVFHCVFLCFSAVSHQKTLLFEVACPIFWRQSKPCFQDQNGQYGCYAVTKAFLMCADFSRKMVDDLDRGAEVKMLSKRSTIPVKRWKKPLRK